MKVVHFVHFVNSKGIKKSMKRAWQFWRTVAGSAWWRIKVENSGGIIPLLKGGLSLARIGLNSVMFWRREVNVDPDVWRHRLKACRACPIYDAERKACGGIGASWVDSTGKLRALGCGCWLPLKTKVKDSACWLEETTGEGRWV